MFPGDCGVERFLRYTISPTTPTRTRHGPSQPTRTTSRRRPIWCGAPSTSTCWRAGAAVGACVWLPRSKIPMRFARSWSLVLGRGSWRIGRRRSRRRWTPATRCGNRGL